MLIRGRRATIEKHALDGMDAERPPIQMRDVARVLEEPDHDDQTRAHKRLGARTIIVYYGATEDEIIVRAVSATRSRLAS